CPIETGILPSALFDGQLAGTRAVKRPSQTGQASTINRTPQQAFRKISKLTTTEYPSIGFCPSKRHPPQSFPRRRFQARYVGHLSQSHHSNISGPHPASESSQRRQQCGRPQPHGVDWDVHGTADSLPNIHLPSIFEVLFVYSNPPTHSLNCIDPTESVTSLFLTRIHRLNHPTVFVLKSTEPITQLPLYSNRQPHHSLN
ncbi:hypothetical protein MJO29_013571, partial [Puccinia striiformis f. sp. tritici]